MKGLYPKGKNVSKGEIHRNTSAIFQTIVDDSSSTASPYAGRKRVMSSLSSSLSADDEDDDNSSSKKQTYDIAVVDLVADKPVTFKSIRAILDWFDEKQQRGSGVGGGGG